MTIRKPRDGESIVVNRPGKYGAAIQEWKEGDPIPPGHHLERDQIRRNGKWTLGKLFLVKH